MAEAVVGKLDGEYEKLVKGDGRVGTGSREMTQQDTDVWFLLPPLLLLLFVMVAVLVGPAEERG